MLKPSRGLFAARLSCVVIDRRRAPPELVAFALRVFRLQLQDSDGDMELYRPAMEELSAVDTGLDRR